MRSWSVRREEGRFKECEGFLMTDPFGNMIELHQVGTCRCVTAARKPVGGLS
jgi:hypothetical protein